MCVPCESFVIGRIVPSLVYAYIMERSKSHALIILSTVAAIYGLIFMERTAPGLVTPELLALFHISPAVLSLMTMGQYLVYAVLQIPVAIGGTHFRTERLLVIGTVADGVGTLLFALSHSFAMVVASRVVVGLGDALIWLNIVSVLARWFSYGVFGRVLGITAMAGNVGALVATVPLALWIDSAGWRMPFVVMGSILVGLAGVSAVIFSRLAPAHPDWKAQRAIVPWRDVLGSGRRIAMVSLAHFGLMGPFLGFVSLLAVPYLRHAYHFSEVAAGTFLGFGLLGSLVGGPVAGLLADRLGVARPYRFVAAINLIGWMVIVVWPTHLPLVVLGLIFWILGMANGASVLTFAAVRERFPSHAVGLASGVANTAGFLSAVFVPFFMGLALSWHPSSQIELAVVLPFAALGLIATLGLSHVQKKSSQHPQV